jgi:O-antigen/teichoic acid export membrane protein
MALGFPMGIFPEVLRGLQKIDAANRIAMIGIVANAVLIAVAIALDWGLMAIFAIAIGCVLVPDALAGFAALRSLPGVQLRPRHFHLGELVETGKFSVFAWLNTIGNLLRNKTDQLVVGGIIGLPAVTLFQAGGKAGEMYGVLTRQISDALSPAAAFLHAGAQAAVLRKLLVKGVRLTVLLGAPLYVGGALYLDFLVRFLTGERMPATATLVTGEILLLWYFNLAITHLVFKRMFMMCGHERKLMWQGLAEAGLNVVLSITLTLWWRHIVGVAVGSLVPTFLFGFFYLWPWAARECGMGKLELARQTLAGPLLACLPMLAVGIGFRAIVGPAFGDPDLVLCLAGMAVTGAVGLAGVWLFALRPEEKQWLAHRLPARFRRTPSQSDKNAGSR